jgi:hypothetical protein
MDSPLSFDSALYKAGAVKIQHNILEKVARPGDDPHGRGSKRPFGGPAGDQGAKGIGVAEAGSAKSPLAAASKALSLLLAGDESGLSLYARCMKGPGGETLPVGVHIAFLEKAGRAAAAAALRSLGLRRGATIAVNDLRRGAEPEAAALEFEKLFERGFGNSRMVSQYLSVLSRLGRSADLEKVADPGRLLRVVRLDGETDPAALQGVLLDRGEGAEPLEADMSIRRMKKLEMFHRIEDPAVRRLIAALRRQSRLYLDGWAGSDHPLARLVPRTFRLKAWGLISTGEGYNSRHIHHKGWATGVYYPAAPDGEGEGGELEVGPPPEIEEGSPGWPRARIRPEPGLLVLMPSFYTHWTIPLGRPGLRTSIAFDLLDTARLG